MKGGCRTTDGGGADLDWASQSCNGELANGTLVRVRVGSQRESGPWFWLWTLESVSAADCAVEAWDFSAGSNGMVG